MTAAMFVLLVTAFFPVIGIRFPWVTIHWIAGLGLALTIVYHMIYAWFWEDRKSMGIGPEDIMEASRFFRRSGPPPSKAGKYPVDHKLYHHIIALVSLGAIVTGLVMMVRIDTPFWVRNPYLLSDQLWGVVYVVHGVTGVALITLVMAHVYFAIRPEKWWIMRSMVRGWVGRKEYLAHHDPVRWVVVPEPPTTVAGVGSMNPGKGPPAGDPPVA
jgi:cytochrome b subunit of formate dehydrogenase